MKNILYYLLLASYPIIAGTIKGIVIDELDNSPMIGANVLLSNVEIGSSTNSDGVFVFSNMDKGEHNLQISIIGYEAYSKSIVMKKDEDLNLIIFLKRKPIIWETINVEGMFPSKHSPEITQIIDNKTLLKKKHL